jgi:hypothetical protein
MSLNPASWFTNAGVSGPIGLFAAFLIFFSIGLGIFVIGVIFYQKEIKKPKSYQDGGHLLIGYMCMGLGMLIALGLGSPVLFTLITGSGQK